MRRLLLLMVSVALIALPLAGAPAIGDEHRAAKQDKGDHGRGKALGHDDDGGGPPQGKARGHAKAKAHGPAKAKPKAKTSKGKAPGRAKAKRHGPAGKTTICHATGSSTNPYVTITISNNALDAHRRHQDGRDIVPAPATGCPGEPATQSGQVKSKGNGRDGKTTICHSTGSATNPFVRITISDNTLDAHRRHHEGRDLIPAPQGDCPGGATLAAKSVETPLGTAPAAAGAVLGEQAAGPPGAVLGEQASGAEPAARVAGADAAAAGDSLPFTGSDLLVLVLAGLAGVLGGFALRRSVASRRGA